MIIKKTVIVLLRVYQKVVSPHLGHNCRFYPSCSEYAISAINQFGVWRGGYLAVCRLLKCHPGYHGKVIDFVPMPTGGESKNSANQLNQRGSDV